MSTVLLTGASGTLGSALLARTPAGNHRIRAAARRVRGVPDGGGEPTGGAVEWARIDLLTGEGLPAAVAGVDVVLHAASAPGGDTAGTDVRGTERLVAAAADAGVRHFVYVSIVGVDRIPLAYYGHKRAAEAVVRSGSVPWTILRGTQFHAFMDRLFRGLARLPVAVAPRGWLSQPIHVDDFADALWRAVAHGPAGLAPDVAGPEVLTWRAMLDAWWRARGRRRRLLAVPVPGHVAAALRRGDATAPDRAVGIVTWSEWLARRRPGG